MRILLVDDDTFLLDMYAMKFSEAGYVIDSAKNGEQAMQKLRSGEKYDGVLLDMVMPGVGGLSLLRTIKDEGLGGSPSCIVLSNQGEHKDIEEAKKEGAIGYIIKAEMIPSEVVEKVTEYLKK